MRRYEMMLILPADADDKTITGVTERITQVLAPAGGEVAKVDRWGKRRFAHPIDKATEGVYLVLELRADPGVIKELDRVLSLADEVIRFKVLVLPDRPAAATPEGGREGATKAAAAAPAGR